MRQLSPAEARRDVVRALGLDPEAFGPTAVEFLAEALRRAAGLLCPCAPALLKSAVVEPLRALVVEGEDLDEAVSDALDALLVYGDLLECADAADAEASSRRLIYAAPPGFVCRESGVTLLVGVAPDARQILPDDLQRDVRRFGHARALPADTDAADRLEALGLREIEASRWLRAPQSEGAARYRSRFDDALARAGLSGEVPGLTIVDPTKPRRFYRGRWAPPRAQSGRFLGRRSQAYGADLWCYVEVEAGVPRRLIDLPALAPHARAFDEAWRLLAAMDALDADPPRYSVAPEPESQCAILELTFPLPTWARRRLDIIGEAVARRGALIAYRVPDAEVAEELEFLRSMLWMREPAGRGS